MKNGLNFAHYFAFSQRNGSKNSHQFSLTIKNTLIAGSDGDLGGQSGDLVQRPVVDDLGVVGALWLPPREKSKYRTFTIPQSLPPEYLLHSNQATNLSPSTVSSALGKLTLTA